MLDIVSAAVRNARCWKSKHFGERRTCCAGRVWVKYSHASSSSNGRLFNTKAAHLTETNGVVFRSVSIQATSNTTTEPNLHHNFHDRLCGSLNIKLFYCRPIYQNKTTTTWRVYKKLTGLLRTLMCVCVSYRVGYHCQLKCSVWLSNLKLPETRSALGIWMKLYISHARSQRVIL